MTIFLDLPRARPISIAEVPTDLRLRIVGAAGAGFPSPAQDWLETAIDLVELLRLDRAASFVFRVSGNSMIDAGIFDDDVVVVDRDATARNSRMNYPATVADEDVEIWGVVRASVRNLKG